MEKIGKSPEETDFLEIMHKFYRNRRFILKVMGGFLIIGLFYGLMSTKIYTAKCTVVPQITKDASMGGLSGLAAMAGINLGSVNMAKELSPLVYPKIMKNVEFRKELMMTPLRFKKFDRSVSIYDYCTVPEYRSFSLKNFSIFVKSPQSVSGNEKGLSQKVFAFSPSPFLYTLTRIGHP